MDTGTLQVDLEKWLQDRDERTTPDRVVAFLRQVADSIEQRGVEQVNECSWYRLNPTVEPKDGRTQHEPGRFHVLHVIWEYKKL